MNVEIEIVKEIPKKQINQFEDRVVYNVATLTREYTKASNSYPYLSGKLERSEIASPITGKDKEYSLLSGVDYAKYVWNMKDVSWTNSSTKPQWYLTNYKQNQQTIIKSAENRALRSLQ